MGAPNFFLSVVVPFFNEKDALPEFIENYKNAFKGFKRTYELVLVDDGSTDDSVSILKDICKDIRNCRIVTLASNYGREAALCAGFRYADLQYTPEDLIKLADSIHPDFPDLVAGKVINDTSGDSKCERRAENARLAIADGGRLEDSICSLRVYSKRLLERAQRISGNTFSTASLLPRIARSLKEVEVSRYPRVKGTQTLKRGVNALPNSARSSWNTVSMISAGVFAAGLVIAVASALLSYTLYDAASEMAIRIAMSILFIGVFSGLSISAISVAMRRIAISAIPLF